MPPAQPPCWSWRGFWARGSSATHRNLRAFRQRGTRRARVDVFSRASATATRPDCRSTWNSKCWDAPTPLSNLDDLWLTGWERSNLGPTLSAAEPSLTGDPHPEQNFFARSDNYALAEKGVVAQTVSSYGLHSDYHQPSDDLAHIDFKHMDARHRISAAANQLAGELVFHAKMECRGETLGRVGPRSSTSRRQTAAYGLQSSTKPAEGTLTSDKR